MLKIGVTGTFCSGKDTFANYLIGKGFAHISLSDVIRDEMKKNNVEIVRENIRVYGNKLRKDFGNDILARKAIEKMDTSKNYVVTSIRNPLEAKKLYSSGNFVLISVDAPIEERFRRLVAREKDRNEDAENLVFEKFVETEKKELHSVDDHGQKIFDCIDMAKITFFNDSSFEEFYKKIDEAMPKINEIASFKRPEWDDYFMELTKVVGTRGTCDRGRSGCVVVKDKRVIATGYVGAPPGLAHCDEVGHWFKKTIHEDNSVTQHCIRTVHAEANAIAQSAKNGISVSGATLYCKMEPCLDCTKLIISSGIKKIICEKRYHASKESREMLSEAGIEINVLNDIVEKYAEQK